MPPRPGSRIHSARPQGSSGERNRDTRSGQESAPALARAAPLSRPSAATGTHTHGERRSESSRGAHPGHDGGDDGIGMDFTGQQITREFRVLQLQQADKCLAFSA